MANRHLNINFISLVKCLRPLRPNALDLLKLLVVAVIFMFIWVIYDYITEESYMDRIAKTTETVALLKEELAGVVNDKKDPLVALMKTNIFLKYPGYSDIFYGLAEHAVPGVWLRDFYFSLPDKYVQINGSALVPEDAVAFQKSLNRIPILSKYDYKAFSLEQAKQGGQLVSYYNFSIKTKYNKTIAQRLRKG